MYVNVVLKNGGVESIPLSGFAKLTVTDVQTDGTVISEHDYSLDGIVDIIVSHGSEPRDQAVETGVPVEETHAPEPDEDEATDAAEAKAKELGVDLSTVEGTGVDGRILVKDVEAAAEAQTTP